MAATKWKKAPDALVQRFVEVLPDDPAIERKQMFGYPCAFFRGHMFCGLFEDQFIVRLSEAERVSFLKQPGAKIFEPMPGRPMKEYVSMPPAVVERHALLGGWLRQSLDYVGGLPPRDKKAKKAPAVKSAAKTARLKTTSVTAPGVKGTGVKGRSVKGTGVKGRSVKKALGVKPRAKAPRRKAKR